jgi:hypothetical protein
MHWPSRVWRSDTKTMSRWTRDGSWIGSGRSVHWFWNEMTTIGWKHHEPFMRHKPSPSRSAAHGDPLTFPVCIRSETVWNLTIATGRLGLTCEGPLFGRGGQAGDYSRDTTKRKWRRVYKNCGCAQERMHTYNRVTVHKDSNYEFVNREKTPLIYQKLLSNGLLNHDHYLFATVVSIRHKPSPSRSANHGSSGIWEQNITE